MIYISVDICEFMREYNFWTTIAFGLFYTVAISVLGAMHTIGGFNQWEGGTDRIVNTPELLLIFTVPLIVLAFVHTILYSKSS